MQKFLGLAIVAFVFCSFQLSYIPLASAQEWEINQRGEVREKQPNSDVWETSEALNQACNDPGKEVPVDLKQGRFERVGFFHQVSIKEYSNVIVFSDGKLDPIEKRGEVLGEPGIALYVVFLLLALVLMVMLNIAKWKRWFNDDAPFAITSVGTFSAAVAIFVAGVFAIAVAAFFAAVAIFVAGVFAEGNKGNKRIYKIFSIVFYISVAVALLIDLF